MPSSALDKIRRRNVFRLLVHPHFTLGVLMHYFAALFVPIIVFAIYRSRITSTREGVKFALVSAAGMYVVTVAMAFAISAVLQWRLAEFDLNHDGVFSPDEQTQAQVAVMNEVIHDAGRNLSVFFAIPWSIVSSFGIFVPAGFLRGRKNKQNE